MARWSDLSKLRQEMQMVQAKVMNMYNRGCEYKDIAYTLGIPEKSVRIIVGGVVDYERTNKSIKEI